MKIGIVLPSAGRVMSGGLKVIFAYANDLARRGHKIIFYAMMDFHERRYRFVPRPVRKRMYSYAVDKYPKWVQIEDGIAKKPVLTPEDVGDNDVIIATAIKTSFFVNKLPERCGKKYYFIQGYENWSFSDEEVISSYQFGMKNIVVSNWLKGIVDKYSTEPSILIDNSVDTNVFFPCIPTENRPRHSITFHYRVKPHKGCKYAFECLSLLAEKYPDLEVVIVSIEKQIKDLPAYCRWVYSASPEDVAEIDNHSRVFLCSSIQEGFGLPGLEAMACGCVLASTNYEGVLEYAVDGENALLSPVKDAKAMSENIVRLFEDDVLYERLRANGIETARSRSEEKSVDKLEKVLMGE